MKIVLDKCLRICYSRIRVEGQRLKPKPKARNEMRITTRNGQTIETPDSEWLLGSAADEIGMRDDGAGNLACLDARADKIAESVGELYHERITWDEFLELAIADQ